MTEIIAANSSASNPDVFVTELRNPNTGAGFYIVRHADSTSKATQLFQLTVDHTKGRTTFGNITLAGRDVRLAYTDYAWGHTHVLFTTGTIAISTTIDGVDVLLLHGRKGMRDLFLSILGVDSVQTTGDLRVKGPATVELLESRQSDNVRDTKRPLLISSLLTKMSAPQAAPLLRASLPADQSSTTAIELPGRRLVLLADSESAATYFQPTISGKSLFSSYYGVGTNETVLVAGESHQAASQLVRDLAPDRNTSCRTASRTHRRLRQPRHPGNPGRP